MPYILPIENPCTINTITAFERFNQIVETYKQIIETNATARCMVGFTAASFIRNEGDIDIDAIESWLQSLDSDTDEQHTCLDDEHNKVNRILNVVKETSVQYYAQGYHHQEEITDDDDSNTDDSEDNEEDHFSTTNEHAYELNRFISCDPYSSSDSYPIYNYIPKYTFVNYSAGNVIIPLDEHSKPTLY